MTQVPFDLKKAQEGHPLITRDGRSVKYVGYAPDAEPWCRLTVHIQGQSIPAFYNDDGKAPSLASSTDLFLIGEKKRGWINIYPENMAGRIFDTEDQALKGRGYECIASAGFDYIQLHAPVK